MDDDRNWFNKFTLIMEQNIRGVQYGVYSVGIIGLVVALRSVRPFKKFTNPKDIPSSFVERHLRLNGRVLRLEPPVGPAPPLLHVDHHPIVSLNWIRPAGRTLPVQVSSVDVSSNGLSWMQHIVVGSNIKFTILKVDPSSVSCIVMKDKCNVGRELVSLGFASVSSLDFSLEKDPTYLRYYQDLLVTENRAERKGTGMWASPKGPSVLRRLVRWLTKKIREKVRAIAIRPQQTIKS